MKFREDPLTALTPLDFDSGSGGQWTGHISNYWLLIARPQICCKKQIEVSITISNKYKYKTRFIKQQNINIIHHDIDATFFFRCFINLHSPQKSLDTSLAFYCSERSSAQTRGSTSSLEELNEDKRRCSQVITSHHQLTSLESQG